MRWPEHHASTHAYNYYYLPLSVHKSKIVFATNMKTKRPLYFRTVAINRLIVSTSHCTDQARWTYWPVFYAGLWDASKVYLYYYLLYVFAFIYYREVNEVSVKSRQIGLIKYTPHRAPHIITTKEASSIFHQHIIINIDIAALHESYKIIELAPLYILILLLLLLLLTAAAAVKRREKDRRNHRPQTADLCDIFS